MADIVWCLLRLAPITAHTAVTMQPAKLIPGQQVIVKKLPWNIEQYLMVVLWENYFWLWY